VTSTTKPTPSFCFFHQSHNKLSKDLSENNGYIFSNEIILLFSTICCTYFWTCTKFEYLIFFQSQLTRITQVYQYITC
jgi:hypothetical protein